MAQLQNVPIYGQITFYGSVVGSTAISAQPVGTTGILIQLPNTVAVLGQTFEVTNVNGNVVTLGWGVGGGGGGGPFSAGNFLPLFTTTVTDPTTNPNLTFTAALQSAGTFYAGPVFGVSAAAVFRAIAVSDIPTLPYVSSVSAPANFVIATPNGSAGVPVPRALVASDIPHIAESQVINLVNDLSTLTTSLGTKATILSPAFTGTPTAPTAAPLTNSAQIATTAYTDAAVLIEQTRSTTAEGVLAAIENATLTGVPQVPTAAPLTNTNQIASTAYSDSAVLVEKTRALAAESSFVLNTSPSFTGVPTAPTAAPSTNNTQIATTAYVDSAVAFFGASAVTSVAGRTGAVVLSESDISGLAASLAALQHLSQRGNPNGYASLDGSGFVPTSELPPSILGGLSFQGTWDASANTPTLTSSVGTDGQFYIVSVAGTTTLDGISSWLVGDWALFSNGVWTQIQSTNTVTSVNGQIGTVSLATADIVGLSAALALKAPLASPTFTGIPAAPTAAPLSTSTQIATTAYTDAAVTIETTRALVAEALLAPLVSPTLTGTPHAPTPTPLNVDTARIATTGYTDAAVAVETTRAQGVEATLAALFSPGFGGFPTVPTQPPLSNNIQIANTAYTDAAVLVESTRALTAEALKAPLANPTFSGSVSLVNVFISGTLADNLSSVGTSGQVLSSTGTSVHWITIPSSSFSSLTSGSNTGAAMVVNTGASLTFSGTGSIAATILQAVAINAAAPTTGQVLTATSPTTAIWQTPVSSGGSVTSVSTSGIATGGPFTTSGTVSVLGSGTTTTAATAAVNLGGAPSGDVVTTDGFGNVQSSGVLLSSLATTASLFIYAPLASPTFTGTVTIATAAVTTFSGNPNFTGFPTLSTSPLTSDNSTKIATTAYVQAQGYTTTTFVNTAVAVETARAQAAEALLVPTSTVTGSANQVLATGSGGGAATLQSLSQSALPPFISMLAYLPNAKFISSFATFQGPSTGFQYDLYTVPAGRRAALYQMLATNIIDVNTDTGSNTSTATVKIGGTYYPISGQGSIGTGQIEQTGLLLGAYIAEAGETFSLQAAVYGDFPVCTQANLQYSIPLSAASSAAAGATTYTGNFGSLTTSGVTATSVSASVGGTAVYHGTALPIWQPGWLVYANITGSQADTGLFQVVSSTATALTLNNPNATALGTGGGIFPAVQGLSAGLVGLTFTIAGFTNASNNGTFLCIASTTTTITVLNSGGIAETTVASATLPTLAVYQMYPTVTLPVLYNGLYMTISGATSAGNNGTFQFVGGNSSGGSPNTFYLANPNAVAETEVRATYYLNNNFNVEYSVIEFDNTSPLKSVKLLNPVAGTNLLYTPSGSKNGAFAGNTFFSNGSNSGIQSIFIGNTGPETTAVNPFSINYLKGSTTSANLTAATTAANGLTTYTGTFQNANSDAAFLASAVVAVNAAGSTFALTAVLQSTFGPPASAQYNGTITNGVSNQYAGMSFTIAGFTNAVNNGTFLCVASSAASLTLFNTAAIPETAAATAAFVVGNSLYTTSVTLTPGAKVLIAGFSNAANNGVFTVLGVGGQAALNNTSGFVQAGQIGSAVPQYLSGTPITVSGFTNAGNNGTFTCVLSTPTMLVLANAGGVAEVHAGMATCPTVPVPSNRLGFGTNPTNTGVTINSLNFDTIANGDSIVVNLGFNFPGSIFWTNVVEM